MTPNLPTSLLHLSYWTHDLNPVIFQIAGPIAVRWYGIAYLLGFLGAYLLLPRLSKRGAFAIPPEDLGNFMVNLAIFGVFIGGRLGYVILYAGETVLTDPLFALRVWEGGMASHGGMIGVFLYLLWVAKKKKVSFWNLTDAFALATPIGLFFGRVANFINGELWGRPTQVAWGVIFPQAGDPLPVARHPSQLYEAFGEGILLFAILWIVRRTSWGKREGMLSALFLLLYAIARIIVECFREPDSTIYFGWLTKGQLYSSFMILGALAILLFKKLWKQPR